MLYKIREESQRPHEKANDQQRDQCWRGETSPAKRGVVEKKCVETRFSQFIPDANAGGEKPPRGVDEEEDASPQNCPDHRAN
jgi:hypothetical protein